MGLIWLAFTGLFLPMIWSNLAVGMLLIALLGYIRWTDFMDALRNSRLVQAMILLYVVQVIGLIYTRNMTAGIFMLEKKLTLLLFPVLLYPVMRRYSHLIDPVLKGIGWITMASGIVMILAASVRFSQGMTDAFYFEKVTPIHYVYYSIYFACGGLILVDRVFDDWLSSRFGSLKIVALFAYALLILTLVASKTGLLMFAGASLVYLFRKTTQRRKFIWIAISVVLCGSILLYLNDTTRARFLNLTNNMSILYRDTLVDNEEITDLTMRLLFWKISISHTFQDQQWLFGAGTGDAQDYINELYLLPQYRLYGYINWDSHNQWIYAFVQVGIPGLFTLGFVFIYQLWLAWRRSYTSMLVFLLVTGGYSLSESILESNKGIVFFALMIVLLGADALRSDDGSRVPAHPSESGSDHMKP